MKTILIGFLIFGFGNLIDSKTIEYRPKLVKTTVTNKISDSVNSNYLKQVYNKDCAEKIRTLENLAANYNIKENPLYDPDAKVSYEVVFEVSDSKIIATYDKSGEIMRTSEQYLNVKLPPDLGFIVSRKYSKWLFNNNLYSISYNKNEGAEKIYSIEIQKGQKVKILKFNLVEAQNSVSYLALN